MIPFYSSQSARKIMSCLHGEKHIFIALINCLMCHRCCYLNLTSVSPYTHRCTYHHTGAIVWRDVLRLMFNYSKNTAVTLRAATNSRWSSQLFSHSSLNTRHTIKRRLMALSTETPQFMMQKLFLAYRDL